MSDPKPRTAAQIAVQFKPGNPGGGRPKDMLRKDEVQAVMGRLARLTKAELQAIIDDPKSTMLDLATASIFLKAATRGDVNRMGFLLDRTIGRVREDIRVETPETAIREEQARIAREIMADPETFEAAERLAAKIARTKVLAESDPQPDPPADDGPDNAAAAGGSE